MSFETKVPSGEELHAEIKRLKEERNAVILAHYYQTPDIQDIADFVGDSLELSRKAAETDADVILFCGVKFMAETAKILSPEKTVILPDMDAGCSLEDSCPPEKFKAFREANPDHIALTYINCSTEVKALSDVIVTSSSAETILQQIPKDQKIIFGPDRHLGGWLSRKFPESELWISRLEYVTCRMLVADTGREAPKAGTVFYHQSGWNAEQIDTYKSRFGGYGRGVSQLPDAYHRLEDGQTFEMAGESWRVVTGHGHSPEHSCLFCPALNVVISGDQLLPRISSNVSVFPTEPEADPLRDWLESCEKLRAELPEDVLVLPAHNEPFKGAHPRLDHLIKGHGVALKRLKQRLGQAPRRVVDVFPAIFGRKIGDDVLSMATGEAIAHLNYLIAEGEAEKTLDAEGVVWYSAPA